MITDELDDDEKRFKRYAEQSVLELHEFSPEIANRLWHLWMDILPGDWQSYTLSFLPNHDSHTRSLNRFLANSGAR